MHPSSSPSLAYAAVPDSHYLLASEEAERIAEADRGDDLLVDPSCACCCRATRVGAPPSPRRCLSCLNVLLLLALFLFCIECGCVVYSVNLLSHLLDLCRELQAAVIAVPVVVGLLWILGALLLLRSFRHRQQAHMRALVRASLTHGSAYMDDGLSDLHTKRRCSRRRCIRLTLSGIFWSCFALFNIFILVVFSILVFLEVHTLPRNTGSMTLGQGKISGPVQIMRSPTNILHIVSSAADTTDYDLFFAQGVAHAQDRLWQMEFQRAVGQGRLGELVGYNTDALAIDRLARTMNFAGVADSAVRSLTPRSRQIVQAYCDGVNSWLHSSSLTPSLEFYILGLGTPSDWEPQDVLVWTKVVSYMLSGNLDKELMRWDLFVLLDVPWDRIEALMPRYDSSRFPTVLEGEIPEEDLNGFDHTASPQQVEPMVEWKNSRDGQKYMSELKSKRAALGIGPARLHTSPSSPFSTFRRLFGPSTASNNWVVSGNLTASGWPLLANDPHLQLMAPSIWILNHLKSPRFESIGASFVGSPGVIIGHNGNISWGVTNTGADCQDLFIMKGNETHYKWRGEDRAYKIRHEIISFKGHHSPETLRVRESHYGPVISDLAFDAIHSTNLRPGPALSLRWTSLQENDTTFDAFMDINLAQGWDQFQQAIQSFVAPSQNMVYADSQGNIGYQMTGRVPLRANNGSGLAPVPGTGEYDWSPLLVPVSEMPSVLNPRKGFVATANNAVVPPNYKTYITGDWDEGSDGYRAKRITELIQEGAPVPDADGGDDAALSSADRKRRPSLLTRDYMQSMQLDYLSGLALDWKRMVLPSLSPLTQPGRDLLAKWMGWDGVMSLGTIEGALFQRWYLDMQTFPAAVTNSTHWDDSQYLLRVFSGSVTDPLCVWIAPGGGSVPSNTTVQSCLGWASGRVDYVASNRGWASQRWGQDVHAATFTHQILTASPLACVADRPIAHGGDDSTINVGTIDPSDNMAQSHGPSYRQILDLDGLADLSIWMHGPGQSGNILSEHYDDLIQSWGSGEYLLMDAVEEVDEILTLQP